MLVFFLFFCEDTDGHYFGRFLEFHLMCIQHIFRVKYSKPNIAEDSFRFKFENVHQNRI